jgi:hypothetical protein
MKKYIALVIALTLFSCEGKKEIELSKADRTIVADVQEHSPIYIFFKVVGKDTIADVNRKNSIVSTNWIFNIDKRLPLRLIVPELIKLQAKKDKSMHKNEAAENYFSYANDVKKTMAFLPFTKVKYVIGKPKFGVKIYFYKNEVFVNDSLVKKNKLEEFINNLPSDKPNKYFLCFDKKMNYDNYIKSKVFMNSIKFPVPLMNLQNEEFIY